MGLAPPSNSESLSSKTSWPLVPGTQPGPDKCRLEAASPLGSGFRAAAHCTEADTVLSSLGLTWAWKRFSALARKDVEKMKSIRVCISQSKTAHNQISLGQSGPSSVFPARHVLGVLTTFSCSHRKGGQSQFLLRFSSA